MAGEYVMGEAAQTKSLSLRSCAAIGLQAVIALVAAWHARVASNAGQLRLPVIRFPRRLADDEVEATVRWVDGIVRVFTRRTGRKCFYRAFARAAILRRRGVPVMVNMGLHKMAKSVETRGHCWLTLDGQPFFEDEMIGRLYPIQMGQSETGVRFWAGPGTKCDQVSVIENPSWRRT